MLDYKSIVIKIDLYNSIWHLTYKIFLSKEIIIINDRFLIIVPPHPCEKQHQLLFLVLHHCIAGILEAIVDDYLVWEGRDEAACSVR